MQIVPYGPKIFNAGIEDHSIEGVPVRVYSPAKTIVDLFYFGQRQQRRYGSKLGNTQALQGMKEALRLRKVTPAAIARFATEAGIWKTVQPYLG